MARSEHRAHEEHPHKHGPGFGHTAVIHDGHVDYLHDGHLHQMHDDHADEHVIAVHEPRPMHPGSSMRRS